MWRRILVAVHYGCKPYSKKGIANNIEVGFRHDALDVGGFWLSKERKQRERKKAIKRVPNKEKENDESGRERMELALTVIYVDFFFILGPICIPGYTVHLGVHLPSGSSITWPEDNHLRYTAIP